MKVVLRSDFLDYYDHWFDKITTPAQVHRIFERYSFQGLRKPAQLDYLASQGLRVPRSGPPAQLLMDCPKIVVYDDVRAHRGLGKRVACRVEDFGDATFAAEFIDAEALYNKATSFRQLGIGARRFSLKYESLDPWRSNVAPFNYDVEISLIDRILPDVSKQEYALYAIDFVENEAGFWAVDFNTAPGLRGTGLEDVLAGREVYETIRDWVDG